MTLELPRAGNRRWALLALSLFFFVGGANHFLNPDFYLWIMPPWLPSHRALINLSGALEIAGALGVLHSRLRPAAGVLLVLVIIGVTPANVHMALNPTLYPDVPRTFLYARLPAQLLIIAWAWWATRPE